MSSATGLRALAFAAPDGSVWGAALGDERTGLVIGSQQAGAGIPDLRLTEDDGGWRLEGDGVALAARALGTEVAGAALCRVSGAAGEIAVEDCPGVWAGLPAPGADRRGRRGPASARFVGGVFTDVSGLALLAGRPGDDAHQDADEITAALLDAEEWIEVRDPRLSTTYDGTGQPTRANLELWVGEGDDEFPRRAAGEAAGPGGAVALADGTLRVVPLRCHSRDAEGAGVYALATF